MRYVRGMRDINTHGTLARQGRLISVARDLHRAQSGSSSKNELWDGNVKPLVFNKNTRVQKPSRDLFQDPSLAMKVKAWLIEQTRESIAEMETFMGEGLSGVSAELQRLKTKLSQVENL